MIERFHLLTFLRAALQEDLGNSDLTTELLIPENHISRAEIVAKEDLVLAGIDVALEVFRLLQPDVRVSKSFEDGSYVKGGNIICQIEGYTRGLLSGERVALNLLQHLSGIATLTARFVREVSDTGVKIVDTRKTTPGLRALEKYAVRVGGGYNHRFGLFDGILIKDNHISTAGGIKKAVERAREKAHHLLKIEVEVKNLDEVKEALEAGADVIMLDNMVVEEMREAVKQIRRRAP
ncbi:MAG: carboxylating nicotinate-nucleotide diphosphorylase, partial [Nitrospirae bacterium]